MRKNRQEQQPIMWLDEWSHTHTDLITEERAVNKKEQGAVNSSFVIIISLKLGDEWKMATGLTYLVIL